MSKVNLDIVEQKYIVAAIKTLLCYRPTTQDERDLLGRLIKKINSGMRYDKSESKK